MPVDIYNSRNTYNEKCLWWSRRENDADGEIDLDELVMKRVPTGKFMAKEVSPLRKQDITIGGVFEIEKHTITIKSPDNLGNIVEKDLVRFRGEMWRVVTVQRSKSKVQNTFFGKDKYCSHYWYLELRK